jgi:hypothetical protein
LVLGGFSEHRNHYLIFDHYVALVQTLVSMMVGGSDLVRVYRAHAQAYRELAAWIQATDWWIDHSEGEPHLLLGK